MNIETWLGSGGWTAAGFLEQAAVRYLMVSLLVPLSWMLAIEVCRRFRSQRQSGDQRREGSLCRVAFSIAQWGQPRRRRLGNQR
jgi:hypothetical protein